MQIDFKTAIEILQGYAADMSDNPQGTGVSFDTRTLQKGDIFVALQGEIVNGSDYIEAAHDKGAAFFITNNDTKTFDNPEIEGRVIRVGDSLKALESLAAWWRENLTCPIVAVTGSAGKTTLKTMIAAILSQRGKGAFSQKSYNNHIGVPYSICNIDGDDGWAVLEMGMNHAGEIAAHSKLARPNIAMITNIAPAHIGMLGSLENIARAKLEIVEGMAPGAPLIVPQDSPVLHDAIKQNGIDKTYALKTFGRDDSADCVVKNIAQQNTTSIAFTLMLAGEKINITLPVPGTHNALNAAGAALLCKTLFPDMSAAMIKAGLESYQAPEMRMNIKTLNDGRILIDDAYNANPASAAAALETLSSFKANHPQCGIILGDMLELGDKAELYHAEIAQKIVDVQPAFVVAVGDFAGLIEKHCAAAGIPALSAASVTSPDVLPFIQNHSWDVLLVKGSRGIGLEAVTRQLTH